MSEVKAMEYLISVIIGWLSWLGFIDVPYEEALVFPKYENFDLTDFYTENLYVDKKVDAWYERMTSEQKIAQLIMPDVGSTFTVDDLSYFVENDLVGGFVILNKNVDQKDVLKIKEFSSLPLLVAMDAEPSLMAYRSDLDDIVLSNSFETTASLRENLKVIVDHLNNLEVNVNFAPVYDNSMNTSVIGDRSFGLLPVQILPRAKIFVDYFVQAQIAPTAKHFPGHGSVTGDTHEELQVLDGLSDLELESFAAAIDDHQVPIMMIGHLAVENDVTYGTDGLPATLSPVIMQKLLRDQMGFRGIVITDAMDMGAIADIENRDVLSLEAGTDIVLMPDEPVQLHADLLEKVKADPLYWEVLGPKIKRILRLKVCLGLGFEVPKDPSSSRPE